METVLIFIVFLCPLIFFHELGHFLFAKLFKVRVEVFSIGFGPKIFKKTVGETQYAISIIPLGGYVKMYGDDPFKPRDQDDPNFNQTYISKKAWQKFLIVFAGPLANFLLALALYIYLPMHGEKVTVFTIGEIAQDSVLAKSGFETGDEILSIQGRSVRGIEDLAILKGTIGEVLVQRDEIEKNIYVDLSFVDFLKELAQTMPLVSPKVVNTKGEVFTLKKINENKDLPYQALIQSVLEGDVTLNLINEKNEIVKTINFKKGSWDETLLQEGLFPFNLKVAEVVANTPAANSGLLAQDVIFKLNGERLMNFTQMRDKVQQLGEQELEISVYRQDKLQTFKLTPMVRDNGEKKMFAVGVVSSMDPIKLKHRIIKISNILDLLVDGWNRMLVNSMRTISGVLALFTMPNAMQMIGGPVTIAKAASDSLSISFDQFLRLMALISINLAILNLLPVPVLDGGHLIFIMVEAILRKPLPIKVLEWCYKLGFSLIISLVVIALYNDLFRHGS